MSHPDPDALTNFEQFAHELGNPLMIVTGHAHLAYRRVKRLPDLPDEERQVLMDGLSEIARIVTVIAEQIERYHTNLAAELEPQGVVADDANGDVAEQSPPIS